MDRLRAGTTTSTTKTISNKYNKDCDKGAKHTSTMRKGQGSDREHSMKPDTPRIVLSPLEYRL